MYLPYKLYITKAKILKFKSTSKEIRTLTVERPRFPKNHSATYFDILAPIKGF